MARNQAWLGGITRVERLDQAKVVPAVNQLQLSPRGRLRLERLDLWLPQASLFQQIEPMHKALRPQRMLWPKVVAHEALVPDQPGCAAPPRPPQIRRHLIP